VGNFIRISKSAERDFDKIVKKNEGLKRKIFSILEELQTLTDLPRIESKKVKVVKGTPKKLIRCLITNNFYPAIFEYRKKIEKYPLRVFFLFKESTSNILVILIAHRNLLDKNLFNKLLFQRIVSVTKNSNKER